MTITSDRSVQAIGIHGVRPLTASEVLTHFADEINGDVVLEGVFADVVAKRGQFASIYGFTGDKTGKTRAALAVIRAYGGGRLVVHDPGEKGGDSRNYWDKMAREGYVDEMRSDANELLWPSEPRQRAGA